MVTERVAVSVVANCTTHIDKESMMMKKNINGIRLGNGAVSAHRAHVGG